MDFQHLKHTLDQLVSEKGAPGVDCSVYQDHREIFRYHTGMKDAEENIPLSGNELYYIFSMTKMLTCVSALQLFEKGAFLMDDPLEKYMEEYSEMYVSLETPDTKDNVSIQTGQMPDKVLKRADGNMAVCKAKKTITIRHLLLYQLHHRSLHLSLADCCRSFPVDCCRI